MSFDCANGVCAAAQYAPWARGWSSSRRLSVSGASSGSQWLTPLRVSNRYGPLADRPVSCAAAGPIALSSGRALFGRGCVTPVDHVVRERCPAQFLGDRDYVVDEVADAVSPGRGGPALPRPPI